MALKALMLRKKINDKRAELEGLTAKDAEFEAREAELEKSIDEAATDEEKEAVSEAVDQFEADRTAHKDAKAKLETEVNGLESELKDVEEQDRAAEEAAKVTTPEKTEAEKRGAEMSGVSGEKRTLFGNREAEIFARDDVKGWIGEIRDHIQNKRDLTNVGLTIPEVFLGVLRENVKLYSKLYKHVNVQRISGDGREVIMGSVPEGVWTECCATLNELSLSFNDVEVDCFKVGGYFKVCNAILEDSDINLASVLLDAIGQAIGLALDKAILYGRNASGTQKMPQGVVSRLVQTSEPSGYPATARTWVDLHTSNIKTISGDLTGIALFQAIVSDSAAMKHKYARREKTWVMNETTYTALVVQAMSINAAGAIVSGQTMTMPIVGGAIEILDFIPDNVIIGGYFELYLLSERAGTKFAQSEHAFFIQDQTAFKGTARYDGVPVIAEAFMAIGINGTTPNATMTFAPDSANP